MFECKVIMHHQQQENITECTVVNCEVCVLCGGVWKVSNSCTIQNGDANNLPSVVWDSAYQNDNLWYDRVQSVVILVLFRVSTSNFSQDLTFVLICQTCFILCRL